jgi:hypothetical protein
MSYEAAIASFGGDETTLAKSFIISIKNATVNWYARLPSRSIASWAQLKEKFLVNFQDFQAYVSTEEDFLSYQQYERETLSDFFHRFLQLKAQAPEVLDEQAIMQAIKAMHASQLHSHLVRERPKHWMSCTKSFERSTKQKYYTSVNWPSKEKQQMRMKVQGHSSTVKVKMAHQISTQHTSKSIAST